MTSQAIQDEINKKKLKGPRITPRLIDSLIMSVVYFTALQGARCAALDYVVEGQSGPIPPPLDPQLGLLTFCVLRLKNGYTVTGESACASPENFDEEIGRANALANAKQKIWSLEGYLLREKLSSGYLTENELTDYAVER